MFFILTMQIDPDLHECLTDQVLWFTDKKSNWLFPQTTLIFEYKTVNFSQNRPKDDMKLFWTSLLKIQLLQGT